MFDHLTNTDLIDKLQSLIEQELSAIILADHTGLSDIRAAKYTVKTLIQKRMKQAEAKRVFSEDEKLDLACVLNNMQFSMSRLKQRLSAYMAKTDTEADSSVNSVSPPSPSANAKQNSEV